jgi:hypothetical protein
MKSQSPDALPLCVNLKEVYSNYEPGNIDTISNKIVEEHNCEETIGYADVDENFERLKNDFLLAYSDDNKINKISNDVLSLELKLMIGKILAIQDKHQKEYISLFKAINRNKYLFDNCEKEYILLNKKINKLHVKKMNNDKIDKKRELYDNNINNFIKKRKMILDQGEYIIWKKITEKAKKSQVFINNKNKMINIFLTICEKKEKKLNKLSFKFYKDIKNKYINNNTNNSMKKLNIFYNIPNLTEKKNIKYTKIKENDAESNIRCLKANHTDMKNNNNYNSKKNKFKRIRKNYTKKVISKDDFTNNNNYETMISDNSSHYNSLTLRKKNDQKHKASSIEKIFPKKKSFNKNQ